MIDSHCHLDSEQFNADREAVIERALAAGVETMVAIGSGADGWAKVMGETPSPEVNQLMQKFVCVYLDTATPEGKKLAQSFEITGCGMVMFQNSDLHERLGPESHGIDFQPFPDVADRVRESVAAIHASPLLPASFTATGFVFHVENGRLDPVT